MAGPDTPLRFTFVLTRYGRGVLGGAEKHARDIAERLAARGHEVQVLTTCATSYTTWKNELPAGREVLGGVEVHRFPVETGRTRPLDEIAKAAASRLGRVGALGRLWSALQGPIAPALVEACEREAPGQDLLIFFAWGYEPQRLALAKAEVKKKSALVPLVHDEPPVYTSLAQATLRSPGMLLANTEEEWARIERITRPHTPPGAIVAVGREQPAPLDPAFVPPTSAPYLLVLGRSGKAKPVIALWRRLVRLAAESGRTLELQPGRPIRYDELKLLLVGEISSAYRDIPNVIQTGFVDEQARWQLLRRATALINPSVHESLSLVLLEAWSCERPVVVNARCDVTVGQCGRSGGGVAVDFSRPELGAKALLDALASFERRAEMGRAGRAYVERRYDWPRVLDAYEAAARAVRAGTSISAALEPWAPLGESIASPGAHDPAQTDAAPGSARAYDRAGPPSAADLRSSAKTSTS